MTFSENEKRSFKRLIGILANHRKETYEELKALGNSNNLNDVKEMYQMQMEYLVLSELLVNVGIDNYDRLKMAKQKACDVAIRKIVREHMASGYMMKNPDIKDYWVEYLKRLPLTNTFCGLFADWKTKLQLTAENSNINESLNVVNSENRGRIKFKLFEHSKTYKDDKYDDEVDETLKTSCSSTSSNSSTSTSVNSVTGKSIYKM
jgi:hypothetical protein